MIDELDLSKLDTLDETQMRKQVRKLVGDFAREERMALNGAEIEKLGDQVYDEMVGLGPIEPLLKDDTIADILINGPFQVYIERVGELSLSPVRFRDNDHLLRIVGRIVATVGRRIDESLAHMVDARACPTAAGSTLPPSHRSPWTAPSSRSGNSPRSPTTSTGWWRSAPCRPASAEFLFSAVRSRVTTVIPGRHRLRQHDHAQRPVRRPSVPASGRSPSRTPPNFSCSSRTWSAWKRGRPTSRARARSASASWSRTRFECGLTG